jgi:hypothetical protein
MMREIFPRVESLFFTAEQTIDQTVDMLRECRVLFAVHGAGHNNANLRDQGSALSKSKLLVTLFLCTIGTLICFWDKTIRASSVILDMR